MSNSAAIEVLERKIADLERKANAIIEIVNDLLAEDGQPPRSPFGSGGPSGHSGTHGHSRAVLTAIKSDTFFGKKLQTAIREYLEIRKATSGDGPATPREIYDAITSGGYQFDAKDETTALIGMRALLRKRTAFFIKLSNGKYGLTSWCPDLKKRPVAEDPAKAKPADGTQQSAGSTVSSASSESHEEDDDAEPLEERR